MADKSTSSKVASVVEEAAGVATSRGKIHPIVKYGDPVLEKPAVTIKKFDAELEQLVEDMFASMYAANGVGLAAPQIGKSIRLTVVDVTAGKN
ncbi:MAG TPA: peptide deformylase, partial [Candidatus Limnocylindrales bacterium]|nr:peptide deformylase [Candidatus Limnocylindrales bacterium]